MAYTENKPGPAHMEPDRKKKSSKKGLVAVLCVLAVVVIAGAGGWFAWDQQQKAEQAAHEAEVSALLDTDTFYQGVCVDGIDLGGKTMEEARDLIVSSETAVPQTFTVTMTYGDQSFSLTQDDVGYRVDTDDVLEEAYQYGRTGTREERYDAVTALAESPVNFDLSASMQDDALHTKLQELTAPLAREPKDASVVSFNADTEEFTFSEGQIGLSVDLDSLTQKVKDAIAAGGGTVEIPVTETPYNITADDLRQNLKKLGTYSTTSTNTANGNYNMARAMASINGTCLQPGETFSYFGVVGPAGRDEGYKAANAIVNGKLVPSYGGGICQTSTTLYGAVLRSGLEIVERSNHSIPSTYCPIGQDAAVSYPSMDFKFKNNTEYPLYIVAGMEGKVLTATLYGWQSPEYDTIEVSSWYTETIPALTQGTYVQDNSLAKGEVKLDAAARKGYRAAAQRIYYKDGVQVKTEPLSNSYYRPSGPYYSYGPGTDISNNPGPTSAPSSSTAASSTPPASSAPPVSSTPPASSTPPTSSAPASSVPASSAPASEQPVSEAPDVSQGAEITPVE